MVETVSLVTALASLFHDCFPGKISESVSWLVVVAVWGWQVEEWVLEANRKT